MYVLITHEIWFYSTLVVITPESSNEFPWISVWPLVKPHAIYCIDILKAHWLRPAFAESYRLLRLTLSKEIVDVYVWNAPDQWHNWRVARVRTAQPPCQTKCKNWAPTQLVFWYLLFIWFQQVVVFLRFSDGFPVISVLCIAVQYRICYCFFTIFWVLANGLPSTKFLPGSNLTASDQSLRLYFR